MHDRTKHEHAQEGWFLHFLTGLLLGLLAIVTTAFLHDLPPVSALDHLGDNLAQQAYAEGEPLAGDAPKLLLLDFDFTRNELASFSDIASIAHAVRLLAPLRPQMLLVDQEIQAASKEVAEDFVAAVQSAAPVPVMLAAAQLWSSTDGTSAVVAPGPVDVLRTTAPNVRFASPTLLRDTDGLIRSVPRSVCITWPSGQQQTVPSLATSLSTAPKPECQAAGENQLEIIFSLPPWAGEQSTRALPRITQQDLTVPTRIKAAVEGAIVIIGEAGRSAWRDRHATPVGMLPGSLIQANALLATEARTAPLHVPG